MSAPRDAVLLVAADERTAEDVALAAMMLTTVLGIAAQPCALDDLAVAARALLADGAERVVIVPASFALGHAALARACGAFGTAVLLAEPLLSPAGVAALVAQRYRRAAGLPVGDAAHHAATLLPPRYRTDAAVSAAPMAAAPLVYDPDGNVAWDRVWGVDEAGQPFCELALAGGPPHRGALLEPVDPASVAADPAGYTRVLDELARGIRLTTGLTTQPSLAPGWIGVRCDSEAMAIWLLRAIIVENVSVRREGGVLYLPAGPAFRVEHETRNVITALAKTHHYWQEHQRNLSTIPDE